MPTHLYHTTLLSRLDQIALQGLLPSTGSISLFGPVYARYARGKIFLSTDLHAAVRWHNRIATAAYRQTTPPGQTAIMLRAAWRPVLIDQVGWREVGNSVYVTTAIPADELDYWHPSGWISVFDLIELPERIPLGYAPLDELFSDTTSAAEQSMANRPPSYSERGFRWQGGSCG